MRSDIVIIADLNRSLYLLMKLLMWPHSHRCGNISGGIRGTRS